MAGNSFPNTIDLAALGANGFKIQGENAQDRAGNAVSAAGDIDGDGLADLIVGALLNDSGGGNAGAAYVVFGRSGTDLVDLDDVAAGIGGFKIQGENADDWAGRSVSAAGDVNGDDIDDLIIGADRNDDSGAAYVVFGKNGTDLVDLDDVAAGNGGFKIRGENALDFAGRSVSAAGDLNGDGLADLIVGASRNGSGNPGAAYVVFGKNGTDLVDLDDVAAGNGGFKIQGENSGDYAGFSVSSAGDINGDGVDDLIVGAWLNGSGGANAGAAYVVFGKSDTDLVDLNEVAAGNGGFKIQGENAGDLAGYSVSAASDVNGDGIDDLIIGAWSNDSGGDYAGAAYVVFGKSDTTLIDLNAVAAGNGGFKIQGETVGDQAGFSVSAAGDVNGDGLADLIVGARGNDSGGGNAGAAYVVFGKSGTDLVDLDDVAAGIGGFKIQGENDGNEVGSSVSAAGDVNGDGVDDLIVGAVYNASGGIGAGAAYVIYGNIAPVAQDDELDAIEGQLTTLDILSNDTDANGTLLPASVAIVDAPTKGTLGAVDPLTGVIDYTPGAGETGLDTFTYTVLDNQGGISNVATVTITIMAPPNDPPIANPDSAATALLTPVVIDVLANDSDPDGDETLDAASVAITSAPAAGTATANPDGTVTYQPGFLFAGTDSFAYTVADEPGAVSNAATVTVTVGAEFNPITGGGFGLLFGTNAADLIWATGGNDTVVANGGDDIVIAGAGNDIVMGGLGDDILFGGAGNDTLSGEIGDDILVGGPGDDRLLGGAGLDTAIFAGNYADHRVTGLGSISRTVQDLVGNGGRDTLSMIELLQFDDGVFDARNGRFTEGAYATPAVEALVTTPGFTTDPAPFQPLATTVSLNQVETLVVEGEVT